MKPDTKAIRERADKATPGEWWVGSVEKWHIFGDRGNPELLAPIAGRVLLRANEHRPYDADLTFIAAAREDVPALCERVEALEAAIRVAIGDSGMPADTHADLCAALKGEP